MVLVNAYMLSPTTTTTATTLLASHVWMCDGNRQWMRSLRIYFSASIFFSNVLNWVYKKNGWNERRVDNQHRNGHTCFLLDSNFCLFDVQSNSHRPDKIWAILVYFLFFFRFFGTVDFNNQHVQLWRNYMIHEFWINGRSNVFVGKVIIQFGLRSPFGIQNSQRNRNARNGVQSSFGVNNSIGEYRICFLVMISIS